VQSIATVPSKVAVRRFAPLILGIKTQELFGGASRRQTILGFYTPDF